MLRQVGVKQTALRAVVLLIGTTPFLWSPLPWAVPAAAELARLFAPSPLIPLWKLSPRLVVFPWLPRGPRTFPPPCTFPSTETPRSALRLILSCWAWVIEEIEGERNNPMSETCERARAHMKCDLTLSFWYSLFCSLAFSWSSRTFLRSDSRSRSSSVPTRLPLCDGPANVKRSYQISWPEAIQSDYSLIVAFQLNSRTCAINDEACHCDIPSRTTFSSWRCNCAFLSFTLRTTACWNELVVNESTFSDSRLTALRNPRGGVQSIL